MTNLKWLTFHFHAIVLLQFISKTNFVYAGRKYTKEDILKLREEVREMFNHAYSGYLKYAYPYDELRPLTCDGVDTWGSYSLTLIDALDTLAVMGNFSEFRRVVDIVTSKANFDANINVSVFETNIRIVGGLLSAHLLSQRAGVELEPGWPCNGPLLRLAEDVAKRLLAAFDTTTGMPYGTVNLRHGVPPGETSITCTAGVGTYIVEFGALSRLTGDPVYEEVALNALYALYHHRSSIGLYGNHIDVMTGRWTAQDSGIGAGVDSYLEYLVKGALLVQRPELMAIFNEGRTAIDKHLKRNDWYLWVSMHKGQVTLPVFQSLEAYWPGVLSLIGDISGGMKSMHNYHQVWKQYGFTPEFYNIAHGQVGTNRESYPLRPELIESTMYMYRATKDPFLLDVGTDILRSIQHSAKTKCGYATIKDCRDHSLENRMESFFLAETTKYLYLLFDPDNFIHNDGQHGRLHTLPSGQECILDAGGYIFNTEAHPLDPGALLCCSENYNEPKRYKRDTARGEKLADLIKKNQNKLTLSSKKETDPTPYAQSNEDESSQELPSAFGENDELSSEIKTKIVNPLQGSEALDVVEIPAPTENEVQQVGIDINPNPLSLNMLQMIEVLISSNIEKSLFKTAWSRDLLVELIEMIESAEKTLAPEKKETHKKSNYRSNGKSILDEYDAEDTLPSTNNSNNAHKSNLIVPETTKQDILSEEEDDRSLTNSQATPFKVIQNKKNSIKENSIESIERSNIGIMSDPSKEVSEEERKEKGLFEVVTKPFQTTIRETILNDADSVMFHLNKCNENLELTKNLVEVTSNPEIRAQFFTKRAEVMILAVELKLSLQETKKLLHSMKPGENITLKMFKRLIELAVNEKTVNIFLEKYEDFMEVAKKLIQIGKENYKVGETSIEHLEYQESRSISEHDVNESEEVTNSYNPETDEDSKRVFPSSNWKADVTSYEVDDKERVSAVSKLDSSPLFTDKLRMKTEAVIGFLPQSISREKPFNPQMLMERIQDGHKYSRNITWLTQFNLLTCTPQPYFTRIMLSGEFYND